MNFDFETSKVDCILVKNINALHANSFGGTAKVRIYSDSL